MSKRLEGRLALVTGASRGIGRAVSLALAAEGADIIAIARPRSQAALESLDDEIRALGRSCTLVPFDLKDHDAIDRLGGSVYERWGKLDIFVGNAGILGPLSPLGHIPPKEFQELLDINVTANYRFIRSLDPLLKASDAGRSIIVSSGSNGKDKAYWGGYMMSKAAVENLALTYANECKQTQVRSNVVNPGPIRTMMRAKAVPGEDESALPAPEDIAKLFVELALPECDRNGEVISFYNWAGLSR
ncbi:MAG: SDR family NAD(P)-dependent oxidoreductase [Kordiimonadaceae bacterium]|nr:SDR family NAD(P)-dependent oxidoreductase [Kordiimonadaceae bacterium]MBO6570380.1 SDR family NAD(P)-dependent oxidoreductase [Kordiimonadaceae bacterium]MBO6965522.1 SDR family NAD(P)-dependent oxidoreductase [Kordiimonadaceae bacterium]